jgi:flavin reductase (DIM6/NTAB) family NADH-FMN oxidoreductase RutF
MICFDKSEIENLSRLPRLNLINSCMGYKSANLIGTVSKEGRCNLAVFSSVTHLGSDPALLSFILRPTTVPRHTYANIKQTKYFSLNAITSNLISKAHQTSANYPEEIDEFEAIGIEAEFKNDFVVPFVKESPLQLLCSYVNEYEIKENSTIHVIAAIEKIYVNDDMLDSDHWIQLDKGDIVAINGLDGYAKSELIERFQYARVAR